MKREQTPREVFQRELEDALAGDDEAAKALREKYEPVRLFLKEGPDVGERQAYDHDEREGRKRWRKAGATRRFN